MLTNTKEVLGYSDGILEDISDLSVLDSFRNGLVKPGGCEAKKHRQCSIVAYMAISNVAVLQ